MCSMRNKVQVRKCEEDVTGGKNQWVRECKRETGLDKKKKEGMDVSRTDSEETGPFWRRLEGVSERKGRVQRR